MSKSDLSRGLKALADAAPDYIEANEHYEGTIEEFFSNAKIANALKNGEGHFRYNFAAIVVDKLADRWKPGALKGSNESIEAVLAEWWKRNTLDEDLDGYLRNAAKLGDYFVTVWPSEVETVVDNDGAESDRIVAVDVFGNSPLTTRLMYSRENSRRAIYGIRVWQITVTGADGKDEDRIRVNLSYADRIEQYVTAAVANIDHPPTSAGDFVEYEDLEDDEEDDGLGVGVLDNPWNVIPLFHFRVGTKPYGTPVHKRAYGPQNAINKIVTTHLSTIDQLGFPQRYARKDADASAISDDFGDVFGDDAEAGDNVQTKPTAEQSRMKAGELWWLEGVAEVGQFEAAGAAPFLEPAEFAIRAMAALTQSPLSDFGINEHDGAQSGEAKRRDAAAQIARAEKERIGLGRVIERMAELSLAMLGFEGEKVELDWLPADISTDKEGIELVGLKITNGVPVNVALKEAGYPVQEVDEWWPEGSPAYPISLLDKLSTSLQALGAGKTLMPELLTDDVVRDILPGLFDAARTEGDRALAKKATVEVDAEEIAKQA